VFFGFLLYDRAGTTTAGTGFFGAKRTAKHPYHIPQSDAEYNGDEQILNDGVKHVAKLKK